MSYSSYAHNQNKEAPLYNPTKEEQEKVWQIKDRLNAMESERNKVDKDWNTYQTMIDAIYQPYPDERSSSSVPLASSLIELYVAEAKKLTTQYKFKSEVSDYSTQAKALEYVWKYDYRKNNRKKEFNKWEYIAAWFGTQIMYVWHEVNTHKQYDPIIDDNNMVQSYEEKIIKQSKIIVKNIDIRDFYIDNHVKDDIEEASDCILRQWISYAKFKNFKNKEDGGIFINSQYVSPKNYSNEWKKFHTEEEKWKEWDYVELLHYWNVDEDCYKVLANDILIRDDYMTNTINGIKALPFCIRPLWRKNYSIYGRWICEALFTFNSDVNNLRELLMDAIRRSNSQVLALGNGLSFDGRTFSYDNEILTFDWNLAWNFEQISGNAPNQAIFAYLDRLYKDIAVFVWIDIQNLIWQPQQTAFQTDVQREASQKRINVWLENRDLAYERFANLYKDALQTYFPRKTAEWLYPEIEIEWEALQGEWENQKFVRKKGKHKFQVSKELLRGDLYVDVHTDITAPTINAVDRAQKLDLLNTVSSLAQWYALAQQGGINVDEILPLKQTLRDLASDYNLQVETKWDEDVQKEINNLQNDLMKMMKNKNQVLPPSEEVENLPPNQQWAWLT